MGISGILRHQYCSGNRGPTPDKNNYQLYASSLEADVPWNASNNGEMEYPPVPEYSILATRCMCHKTLPYNPSFHWHLDKLVGQVTVAGSIPVAL